MKARSGAFIDETPSSSTDGASPDGPALCHDLKRNAVEWPMPNDSYFLRTRRLGFRCWREEDLALARALWGDPAVTRFIAKRGRLGTVQVRARLLSEIAGQDQHGVQYWPIFRLETGQHVGCCGLRPFKTESSVYELGVHIRSPFWRQGLAREAAGAAIRHAFEVLGAAWLFAGHHPQNAASRQLLERLGFRYTHDDFYEPTGLYHPSYRLDPAPGRETDLSSGGTCPPVR